jgi:endogenous inhibitor of DNA gyrase (YacG/DUF329 family)
MSKQIKCDECDTTVAIAPDSAYERFPEGWLTVIRRDPVKMDEYRDYCSAGCAMAALDTPVGAKG